MHTIYTERMNKIAFVSHTYPTREAPAQASFIKKEAHLIDQDCKIEIHLPAVYAIPYQKQYYRTHNPDENNIPIHQFSYLSFPGKRFASITQKSLSRGLLKSIGKQKPNIVHLHWLYPAGLTANHIKNSGYPVVLTIHGGDWYTNQSNRQLMPILATSLHSCDRIICVGKKLVEDIGKYDPKLKNKLVYIPHGINTQIFYPLPDKDDINYPQGWNREKTNMLCVANFYYNKGIDILINAFSQLPDLNHHHLHIISPNGDKKTKNAVNHLIDEHKLQKQITIYGSKKPQELADYYRAADLLISPSRKEGFGLVVAEAIACGTPVLATQSGGPEEIVNSDSGTIVKEGSAESLSKGIEDILDNLTMFQPDKMNQHIKSNYSIIAKKKKLLSVYNDIVD